MKLTLRRRLRLLEIHAGASAAAFVIVAAAAFSPAPQSRFGEITAERINIVDAGGRLRIVISNKDRFPMNAIVDGKSTRRQGPPTPGMLFYNDEGDESGGLFFSGTTTDGRATASAALMFDQFKQDQTVGIMYQEEEGERSAGFHVWDRPATSIGGLIDELNEARRLPAGAERDEAITKVLEKSPERHRVFVGKATDRASVVVLSDTNGTPRLTLRVEEWGDASIEFLDAQGQVVRKLP